MTKGQDQLFQAALAARKAKQAGPKVERRIDDDLTVEIQPTVHVNIQVNEETLAGPITQKNTTPLPKAPKRVAAPVVPPTHQEVVTETPIPHFRTPEHRPSAGVDLSKTDLPALLETLFAKVTVGTDRIIVADLTKPRICVASLEPINRCIERLAREINVNVNVEYTGREGRYRVYAK